ncbi:RnfABCDGE type electron transport complex subunit D [bacterium]|nr:RnfABCDGE type electron transport complex subunit D [bacterium]
MQQVLVSDSPHVRSKRTTKHIMLDVIIALLPAAIIGCVYFGLKALMVLAISTATAVATEIIYSLLQKKDIKIIFKEFDFTSIVTGLLLGLTLSSTVPWYVPFLASIFAIAVVKMLFGGTGKNIVNPAIAGRVFAFIAFQGVMISGYVNANIAPINGTIQSGATALTALLNGGTEAVSLSSLDLFLGTGVAGCIGETSKLALLIGGIYLCIRRVISWQYPTIYIIVTGLMAVILSKFDFALFLPSILSGGLFLGAIFMATDYVTSPNNKKACYIYFVLLGIITAVLRKATHIEVVSFAILLMNLIVPLFNSHIRPRPFGAPSAFSKIKAKLNAKKEASK